MADNAKRGASGGNARAAKLSKEERSAIAKQAAQRRWSNNKSESVTDGVKIPDSVIPVDLTTVPDSYSSATTSGAITTVPQESIAESLPYTTPIIPSPEPPKSPQKPSEPTPAEKGRRRASKEKPVSKVYRQALSIAEKEYSETVEELAFHDEMAARMKSRLPRLIQTIRALGGTIDPQAIMIEEYQGLGNGSGQRLQPSFGPITPQQLSTVNPMPNDSGIDPALYQANSGPIPRSTLSAQAPLIDSGVALGGTEELDWVTR